MPHSQVLSTNRILIRANPISRINTYFIKVYYFDIVISSTARSSWYFFII